MLPMIGAAMMRAGGSIAGSSAARSTAGSILSTGGNDAISKILKSMEKNTDKMQENIKKVLKKIEQASPALKQQLIIIRKSFELFLRPIGDIMAKFVRPMAIWFLKLAAMWNNAIGKKTKLGNEGDPEDLAAQIAYNTSKDVNGVGEGGTTKPIGAGEDASGSSTIEDPGSVINKVLEGVEVAGNALLLRIFKPNEALEEAAGTIWGKILPESVNILLADLKTTWDLLLGTLLEIWEIIDQPVMAALNTVAIILGGVFVAALWAIDGAVKIVNVVLYGLKTALEWVNVGLEWINTLFNTLYSILSGVLAQAIDWLAVFIKDTLVPAFDKFLGIIKSVVSFITSIKIPSWLGGKKTGPSAAVGGLINETGPYTLHAGERVLTAGETSKSKDAQSINITNHFNIPATINSDIDIRSLAMKLADYSEKELRRRVSYI